MSIESGQNSYDKGMEAAPEREQEHPALPPARRQELQAASLPAINRVAFGAALEGYPNELWR